MLLIRIRQVVTYKRLKTIENHLTFRPKEWSWSFSRGFDQESLGVLDWRSFMGGGCLREVVTHGGSTVFETHTFTMAPHNVHLHLTQVYLIKSQFNDRAPAV